MRLKLEPKQFDEYQEVLIDNITETIKIKLLEAGLQGETLEHLTAEIAFSIASTIDDTTGIESDGVAVRPYLSFRTETDELVHCGENSYTHEYVFDALKRLFK